MKRELLNFIVCPETHEKLVLMNEVEENGEIVSGELISTKSKKKYKIDGGVPDLVPSFSQSTDSVEGFGFEWTHKTLAPVVGEYRVDLDLYKKEIGWKYIDFNGKKVLEVGCGMGRLSPIFLKENIVLFSLDLSISIYEAYKRLGNLPNVHFIRADMAHTPFVDDFFDIVIATGVLQHTKKPQETIIHLGNLLKPSGYLIGGIYMIPEKFLTYLKVRIIDVLRFIFKFFPPRFVYHWSYLSVLCFHRVKFLYPIGRIFFLQHPFGGGDERATWLLNHDQYISGSYQYKYTRQKTLDMFRKAGLTAIRETVFWDNSYVFKKII